MNRSKTLGTLGLAYRAGKVASGEDMVLKQLKSGAAKLVFLATDAGNSTMKRFRDKCAFYGIPLDETFASPELSHAIGKTNRKVLAVCDPNFAILLNGGQDSE